MIAYDFTRRTHRVRWWVGYYLMPWRARPWWCEWRGHREVVCADRSEGFDTVWCQRCGEVLRG